LGIFPAGFVDWTETALDAVCVITAGIDPENDRCTGMNELAGYYDFIAPPWNQNTWF
jgi:hypothetical protein